MKVYIVWESECYDVPRIKKIFKNEYRAEMCKLEFEAWEENDYWEYMHGDGYEPMFNYHYIVSEKEVIG